ncbi:MAG: DUF4126 family protein [Rhodospirillales bacterium]|nr:DUF4126 family protein [Rhodospirillales bacterium]
MEQFEHIASILALTMGVSWASGINLYAAMAVLGISSATGNVILPPDLQILANPLVITASCIMYMVEFAADKVPGVDTAWDSVHTFIRIPAGAMLAAGAVGDVGMAMELSAAILGGGMAAASHATKAGSRVIINASPEPFTNWAASIGEDVAVLGGMWTALHHPWIFLGLMILFIIFMIWVLPKIWRGIKKVFRWIAGLFGAAPPPEEPVMDAAEASGAASPEVLDRIERLKALYDAGTLTEEEFNRQKAALLGTKPAP